MPSRAGTVVRPRLAGVAAAATSLRPVRHDAVVWALVVTAGLAFTALLVAVDARLGTASAPFLGRYRLKVEIGTVLAPAVAAAVLVAVSRGLHERLPWRRLLLLSYLAAAAWAIALAVVDGGYGLANPVENPQEYLRDVPAVAGDPLGFLDTFVQRSEDYSVATRQHPPGPVLLLWALTENGFTRPAALGTLVTLVGCASVPLVAIAARSLLGEQSARRLLPLLILAPYAIWLAVSLDAVTMTIAAAALTCGVVGSEPRRPPWWAAAAGLLLGTAALFSYAVGWLAVSGLAVYFIRRRPLLILVSGAAGLVPLALAQLAGFTWSDGLSAAQADFSLRVEPHRSWVWWIFLDVVILTIACGPAIAAAARKIRRTPGWPFLVGAGIAVLFAMGSGIARGEVERSWLPFFPWLLVAAVAPERRPAEPEDETSSPTPVLLVALGAASAVVLEAVLQTTW